MAPVKYTLRVPLRPWRVLTLLTLCMLVGLLVSVLPVNGYTQTLVWSANFEHGDNSQFNGAIANTCHNGIIGVSSIIVHKGTYSGYYYGKGNSKSASDSCREYPSLNLDSKPYLGYQPISNFYFKMWIYIPKVSLKSWISFATFGTGDLTPFTIDCNPSRQIQLFVSVSNTLVTQNLVPTPRSIPFDNWFSISLYAYGLGTSNGQITIYQNGTPIIQFHGTLLNGPLTVAHFGLYMSNDQPSFAIYNDDLSLWKLS